jgi:hypothetical protein
MAQGGSGGIRQFIGLTGEAEVKKAFQSLGQVGEKAFRQLSNAATTTTKTFNSTAAASHKVELGIFKLAGELTQTTQKMQYLSEAAGSLTAGLTALLGLEGARKLFEGISALIDPMNELRKTSAALKIDPSVIKGYGEALANAGLQSSGAAGSLSSFADVVASAQKSVKTLNNNMFPTIDVMRGSEGAATSAAGGMNVMRGAVSSLTTSVQVMRGSVIDGLNSTGDAFERLGIKVANKGIVQLLQETAQRVTQLGDNLRAVDLRELMGIFKIDDAEAFLRLMKQINDESIKARAAKPGNLGPTPEEDAQLKAYNATVANLGNEWTRTKELMGAALLPLISLETRGAGNLVKGLTVELGRIKDGFVALGPAANEAFNNIAVQMKGFGERTGITAFFAKLWTDFTAQGNKAFVDLTPTWDWLVGYFKGGMDDPWQTFQDAAEGTFNRIMAAWDTVTKYLADAAKTAWDAAKPFLSAPGGVLPAPGLAAGGMVRGPGGIDKIPARLTRDEFVMRTAAVRHWGVDFMAAINNLRNPLGFAEGGLVGLGASLMPASGARFAEGGLAATEAGTPVHLHFPSGGQVQLHGDKAVVRSLLREARRAGMVSAGRSMAVA